jgi:steroid delta-isomerase-like uncharacterized protein
MGMRQANQEVVLRHHKEIWSEGRLESIPELLADDFVAHHPGAPDWSGLEDVRAIVQRTRDAFPDFHESVEDVMVDGDRVITRFVARGTHLGAYQGLLPTGKSFAMAEIGIFRMEGGKIVEKWGQVDRLGMYRQLGINLLEPRSRLLYEITMPLEPAQDLGPGPNGHRRIFIVKGGHFIGPRLKGIVLPGGGDWTVVGPDGSARLDVRITLRTDDDALIYAHYEGVLHAPSDVIRRLRGGEPVDPSEYYFRVTPFFETAAPKYAWLNKIVSVGVGRRGATDVSYTVHELL